MKKSALHHLIISLWALIPGSLTLMAQPVNYDEAKVPHYVLPNVLQCDDGHIVTTTREWERTRRPEVMRLLATHEYGLTPQEKISMSAQLIEENPQALDGRATMQQVRLRFEGNGRHLNTLLLVLIPNNRKGRVPVFIGYNFWGNHGLTDDPSILYSPYFASLTNRSDSRLERANQTYRWPLERIVERGYALVTMCYHDIFPDQKDGRSGSAAALFSDYSEQPLAPDAWQAIGVWAWGSSRIADWVERQPWANASQLAIIGHSRQGKAALWAGAQDERFQVVISNNSGCGGAALSKRVYGENVARITQSFPHWFCPRFAQYAGHEDQLPFDQHYLISLIAPRRVYVASAQEDTWADPKGEFLAASHAADVYHLYGLKGLETTQQPPIHSPIHNHVAYHIRAGGHNVMNYDWEQYMDYCDKAWNRK